MTVSLEWKRGILSNDMFIHTYNIVYCNNLGIGDSQYDTVNELFNVIYLK